MFANDSADDKHFNYHFRARRFDPESKFGCLHGRTACSRNADWSTDLQAFWFHDECSSIQIERPRSDLGTLVSALDLATPCLWSSTRLAKSFCRVLLKRGQGELLMEELAAIGATSEVQRFDGDKYRRRDFAHLTFTVDGAGHHVDFQALKLKKIPELLRAPPLHVGGDQPQPKCFVKLPEIAPTEIDGVNLTAHAKLKCSNCSFERSRRGQYLRPWRAFVSHGMPRNLFGAHQDCWIAGSSESWLEVDLGADCIVSHISTMGRFPPMICWPRDHSQIRYEVVNDEHSGWQNWTTRYEVSIRADGGRSWIDLGEFRGNVDMTSEVVHDLGLALQSKSVIRCRFLRFRPLTFRGKPALRVGVYGTRKQIHCQPGVSDELVSYKFPVRLPDRNVRKVQRDFVSRRRNSPDWYGKHGRDWPSQRRRAALRRSVIWEETCDQVDVSDDDGQDEETCSRSLPVLHEWLPALSSSSIVRLPSSSSWELVSADSLSNSSAEWELC